MTALPGSGSFTMVDPTHVAAVGPAAAILYARIWWRAGDGVWRATREVMAQETGLTLDQIRTAVKLLRAREWVTAERAGAYDATLVWRPVFAGHAEKGNIPMSSEGNPAISTGGNSLGLDVGNSPISSSETLKTIPPTPQGEQETPLFGSRPETPAGDPLQGFDEWYGLFPRKVAKGDARKAWTQVTRRTAPAVILAGLRRTLTELQDQHVRGFCPYPASWLRAERWEDAADNVTPLRPPVPAPDESYDPAYEATLPPPPRQDLYG